MKNLRKLKSFDSLLIAVGFLIVAGCRCQSEALDFLQLDALQPATKLQTGTYAGAGVNTTHNVAGDFLLRVEHLDYENNGNWRAENIRFEASNGLTGRGDVFGRVNAQTNELNLSGILEGDLRFMSDCQVGEENIRCDYTINDPNLTNVEKGNFTITRR